MEKEELRAQAYKELALREKARRDFYTFLQLKWARFDQREFLNNWHFAYLAKVLSSTIPQLCAAQGLELNTRIMLNMPPSYGKTETLARSFIPYALGVDRSRKFMYVSYSDELCKRISNEVRSLIKSRFWQSVFKKPPEFIQDNSNEFIFKEGGGCFFTTLKSAITGFHAHCILIDDPIKVSEMSSRVAREQVNQNFQSSVISRLKDNQSSIVILMQRLGDEDLCGFLTNPKYQEASFIEQWKILKLQALNKERETYQIGDFCYIREPNTPLFEARHNVQELEKVRAEMGEDDFSTQMQQEPQARISGFFDLSHFTAIAEYLVGECLDYVLIDTAESTRASADDRAIVVVGVENCEGAARYIVKDCIFGIFDEDILCERICAMLLKYPKAPALIEGTGGGLIIERILNKKIVALNSELKLKQKAVISNVVKTYPTIKKITKMQKIAALKPYLNTGNLRYLPCALGIDKIQAQLSSFNPDKPHRKNDCIDALASAVFLEDCAMPYPRTNKPALNARFRAKPTWRV